MAVVIPRRSSSFGLVYLSSNFSAAAVAAAIFVSVVERFVSEIFSSVHSLRAGAAVIFYLPLTRREHLTSASTLQVLREDKFVEKLVKQGLAKKALHRLDLLRRLQIMVSKGVETVLRNMPRADRQR